MRAATLAAALVVAYGASAQSQAQSQSSLGLPLPATGVILRPEDLQPYLERAAAANGGPASQPGWLTSGGIGVQEQYSDAPTGDAKGSKGGGQFVTVVTPSLQVHGDTRRVSLDLNYAPGINLYPADSRQDSIAQQFNGSSRVTLLPGSVFVDLEGFVATLARNGALGPQGTAPLGKQTETQSYLFSVAPYAQHRFGGLGTGEIGYVFAHSGQNAGSAVNPYTASGQTGILALRGFGHVPNQELISNNEHASFTTGEALGRFNDAVLLSASQFDGSGVLRGASRDSVIDDLGYAVTRTVTLLGRVGWEQIRYTSAPPIRIDDAVWGVGTRLTPGPDSVVTWRYGHQDGATSISLDSSFAVTARIKLFARYSEGLTTSQEDLQNAVASAVTDPLGNLVDRATGAPVVPVNAFFSGSEISGVSRLQRLSLTGTYLVDDRDSLTVSLSSESNKLVAQAPGAASGLGGSTRGTYGSVGWAREITPWLTGSVTVQYGVSSVPGGLAGNGLAGNGLEKGGLSSGSDRLTSASASLSYAISQTVTGSFLYSFNNVSSGLAGQNQTDNLVALGIQKWF